MLSHNNLHNSCESLSQLTICMAYVVSMYKSIYTAMHISQLGH